MKKLFVLSAIAVLAACGGIFFFNDYASTYINTSTTAPASTDSAPAPASTDSAAAPASTDAAPAATPPKK